MRKTVKWQLAQTAELKWWKNYLSSKPKESYLEWKKAYWESLLDRISEQLPLTYSHHILDAGCGPAGIFIALPHQQVDAIDPLLDKYKKDIPQFVPTDYPNVNFTCLPLEQLNKEGVYDIVFCMNAINHVSDIDMALDNLVNAAKPNSYLVLTIDAHNHAFCKHIFRWLPGDILHPHQYDLTEYKEMLEDRGCELLKCVCLKKEFLFNHYVLVAKTWW